jgi:Xaa-Pro aminopeptidase
MNQRVIQLQKQLDQLGLSALLITNRTNIRYISGFTGTSGVILLTGQDAFFITDFRYLTQVREQCPGFTILEQTSSKMYGVIADVCKRLNIRELSFESEHLLFAQYQELHTVLGDITLTPTVGLVEKLRSQKTEDEIATIEQAIHIAESAFIQLLDEIQLGMTEKQLALRLEWLMRERGASGVSFDMIVASGARSALPHGVASDKAIATGELVTFDFGCYYQGYVSDITRTIAIGSCSEEERTIYELVRQANEKAIAGISVGMTAQEVDAIARNFLTEAGYGEQFGHGTGHGIGLDIHEFPRLGVASEDVLTEGMIVTVEPGIYLEGRFGVRIEDDVLLTADGYRVLTSLPKGLIIL